MGNVECVDPGSSMEATVGMKYRNELKVAGIY
jgi:hypothetical protein